MILTCWSKFLLSVEVIKVDHDAHGVDTPEDVEKIESLMRERNLS
jgi:3-deoxy-manno-octulosonate cytidylyltransferase (CMP-KDO synthetase)